MEEKSKSNKAKRRKRKSDYRREERMLEVGHTLEDISKRPKLISLLNEGSNEHEKREINQVAVKDKVTKSKNEKKSGDEAKRQKVKTGYVLFVGRLPFSVTANDIQKHFEEEGCQINQVRLISHKDSGKSKGFAFIDFKDNKSLRLGLGLDKSSLHGNEINVEFTTVGSKGSETRMLNIKRKNEKLAKFKQLPDIRKKEQTEKPRPFHRGVRKHNIKTTFNDSD